MKRTLLITDKLVEPEQRTELRRNGHVVKVLHLFEPEPDIEHLRLVNHLDWVEKVLIDDDLFHNYRDAFSCETERLGQYVYTHPSPPADRTAYTTPPGNVLFIPCNDTHVKMLLPVAQRLGAGRFLVIRGENAEQYLTEHGVAFDRLSQDSFWTPAYRPKLLRLFRNHDIRAIVFGNDWTGENWRICHLARRVGVPTVCIEEGPQDFDLEEGRHAQMQHADYVFLQGLKTLDYCPALDFYVSGNPRLSTYKPLPLPEPPVVMINSNFTYGVHEDARDRWIAACVAACAGRGVDYFISKHPRDTSDLSRYNVINSDAFKLPEQLARCNVVITRFSQVVHEAMLSGRQVIYYNPHGEVKPIQTEDRTGGYFHAANEDELADRLATALLPDFPNRAERDLCNRLHCGPCDGREVERCVWGICRAARLRQETWDLLVKTPPVIRELIRRVRRRNPFKRK